MEKPVNITMAISLSGLGLYLAYGEFAQMRESEILQEERKTNVYQCELIGRGRYRDYRKHCILGQLVISGRLITISCCL